VLMLILLHWVPRVIDARGGYGMIFRAAWLGPVVVFVGLSLNTDHQFFAAKTFRVAEGVDTLYTYPPYGESVRATLDEIRAREKPDETLLVVPEGVMLNYLARRRAPTPYFNFMPPELIMFGEETIVSALRQHPPDLLVWAPRSMPEYGYEGLGRGYGTRLYHWIKQDFHTISDPSAPQRRFPMLLLAPNAGQRPTKP